MADPNISDYEFDDDDMSLMQIIPQFDLQADFIAVDSEDYAGEKDITGTDVEWENQEADHEATADDVVPVQIHEIERRFNKLSTLIVHSLTPVPFFLSFCIHLFIPNIKVLTIWREVVHCRVAHFKDFLSISVLKI